LDLVKDVARVVRGCTSSLVTWRSGVGEVGGAAGRGGRLPRPAPSSRLQAGARFCPPRRFWGGWEGPGGGGGPGERRPPRGSAGRAAARGGRGGGASGGLRVAGGGRGRACASSSSRAVQVVRSASVGARPAARTAGYPPATNPIPTAAATPPHSAYTGTATA